MVCYNRPTVYAYVPNFISIGLFCRTLLANPPPIFCRFFWTSAFSVVASCQQSVYNAFSGTLNPTQSNPIQSDKVEHGCTTTNLSLSKGIKIVSVLQCLHGEIGRAISDVQKCDEQTDRQKTQRFWPPWRLVKSEPHQTWTSSTFLHLQNFWVSDA